MDLCIILPQNNWKLFNTFARYRIFVLLPFFIPFFFLSFIGAKSLKSINISHKELALTSNLQQSLLDKKKPPVGLNWTGT